VAWFSGSEARTVHSQCVAADPTHPLLDASNLAGHCTDALDHDVRLPGGQPQNWQQHSRCFVGESCPSGSLACNSSTPRLPLVHPLTHAPSLVNGTCRPRSRRQLSLARSWGSSRWATLAMLSVAQRCTIYLRALPSTSMSFPFFLPLVQFLITELLARHMPHADSSRRCSCGFQAMNLTMLLTLAGCILSSVGSTFCLSPS
jgi:hypothetical protein